MKIRSIVVASVLGAALAGFLAWRHWERDAPRRHSLQSLSALYMALNSSDPNDLLNSVTLPLALQNRTAGEQAEFLHKALRDEISDAGLVALQRRGTFGALKEIFPAEAATWAGQAGVNPDDCVAFKLEQNGLRAEVVLVKLSTINAQPSIETYHIVRCNNVKQLAVAKF